MLRLRVKHIIFKTWVFLMNKYLAVVRSPYSNTRVTKLTASMIILSPDLLFQFWEFNRFLYLLGTIFLVFIAIRYPEAVLISHAQLNRALNVYSSIMDLKTEKEIQDFGMSSLVAYIKQIPLGLIDKSADIWRFQFWQWIICWLYFSYEKFILTWKVAICNRIQVVHLTNDIISKTES